MVKFVISCCVVSKQVQVSTILASVESTGSWLHAGTCPVFVHCVGLEIARYPSNSPILLNINQPAYFMERNMEYIYILRTTQRTNTGQVLPCRFY